MHNTIAIRFLDEMILSESDSRIKQLLLRSIKKLNLDLENANFRTDITKQIQKALEVSVFIYVFLTTYSNLKRVSNA